MNVKHTHTNVINLSPAGGTHVPQIKAMLYKLFPHLEQVIMFWCLLFFYVNLVFWM